MSRSRLTKFVEVNYDLAEGMMTTTEFDPQELRQKYQFERDKRLRAEGNEQYTDISDFAEYLHDP